MKDQTSSFIVKVVILAFPLIVLLGSYIYWDPFKVIYKYDSYYESGKPSYVTLNKGFVSIETFLHNYSKYAYDSFVFGSSRSIFYRVADWKKYIHATECFHFDASGETLYGIYKKLEFLQKNHVPIKNAIIVVDAELLSQTVDPENYLLKQHPRITSELTVLFQWRFLKTYFDRKFLFSFLDFKLRGKIRPYMTRELVLDDRPFTYDRTTNEVSFDYFEKMIDRNMNDYYGSRKDLFYSREPIEKRSVVVIGKEQEKQLVYIKDQLNKNDTRYKIIISPLYDQKRINSNDYDVLCKVFGSKNVFDFSGINDLTASMYNYYETSHYRPHVCKLILDRIYAMDEQKNERIK